MSKQRFITLTELCDLLQIGKQTYYKLVHRGVFPAPMRAGNRPVFDQDLTQQCVEVVKTRVGINGEPVLFNRKPVQETAKRRSASVKGKHEDLIAALASLGLSASVEQVTTAIAKLPNAGADLAEPALIKAVFLHLKKQG